MKRPDLITKKILTTQEAVQRVRQLKMFKKKGCVYKWSV